MILVTSLEILVLLLPSLQALALELAQNLVVVDLQEMDIAAVMLAILWAKKDGTKFTKLLRIEQ